MNKFFLATGFLLLFILQFNIAAANSSKIKCESIFQPISAPHGYQQQSVRHSDLQNTLKVWRLQSTLEFLRKINGTLFQSSDLQVFGRFLQLKQHIKNGGREKKAVVDMYRNLFSQVESNYFLLNKYYDLREKVLSEKPLTAAESESYQALRKQHYKLARMFGSQYSEYLVVRTFLEGLANKVDQLDTSGVTNETVQPEAKSKGNSSQNVASLNITKDEASIRAKEILESLGGHDMGNRSKAYGINQKTSERVSINDITRLFRRELPDDPDILLSKLYHDLHQERGMLLTTASQALSAVTFGPETVNTFLAKAYLNLPKEIKNHILILRKSSLDMYLRSKYIEPIERISERQGKIQDKLALLIEENAKTPNDELLYAFARTLVRNPEWLELVQFSKLQREQFGTNSLQGKFYERMAKASKSAIEDGELTYFANDSFAVYVSTSIRLIGFAVFVYLADDDILPLQETQK
jgi:hypothetical protein